MNSGMELEFRYRFEAAHRFLAGSEKCKTPHGHSWYATLSFSAMDQDLDSNQMSQEFSRLKAPWKEFILETADHSYLHHFNDSLAKTLRAEVDENYRLLAFPGEPTTELIASLFLKKALIMYSESPIKPFQIYIEETQTNRLRMTPKALEQIESQLQLAAPKYQEAWWNQSKPSSRNSF